MNCNMNYMQVLVTNLNSNMIYNVLLSWFQDMDINIITLFCQSCHLNTSNDIQAVGRTT